MNAVGPVEPGDGTRPPSAPPLPRGPRGLLGFLGFLGSRRECLTRRYGRHRRTVLVALTAAAVLAAGTLLHVTRPRQPPPPAPPLPSGATTVSYP
ncbi:hypothetical protein APS67_003593 [Streptomyces sp. AVP053U2]|nr:hypothetical protein APS67_003593 [Streptomyces sp. AVP053U2]